MAYRETDDEHIKWVQKQSNAVNGLKWDGKSDSNSQYFRLRQEGYSHDCSIRIIERRFYDCGYSEIRSDYKKGCFNCKNTGWLKNEG